MKQFERFRVYDDDDLTDEIWPKSKPIVSKRMLAATFVCIIFVLGIIGGVLWLMGKL